MNELFDLHLFEGEGGDAAAADSGSQGEQTKLPGTTRRGKSGERSNVLYGIQDDAGSESQAAAEKEPEVQVTSNTLEDNRKAFRDLINGEYKDAFSEETQRIINRRFAETKSLQKQVDDSKPILDKLAQRYNVLDGDMAKLAKAIDDDDSYWESAAEDMGMSVAQYKEYQRMRQQNAELLAAQKNQAAQARANAQMQQWFQESEALKSKFKGFDFSRELENPQFRALLQAGTPVEHAYKVIHFDALMGDAVQATAANTEKAVVSNIRTKGSRPAENGTSSQSTFTVKRHASQLDKKDRAEVVRRALAGETIDFG